MLSIPMFEQSRYTRIKVDQGSKMPYLNNEATTFYDVTCGVTDREPPQHPIASFGASGFFGVPTSLAPRAFADLGTPCDT